MDLTSGIALAILLVVAAALVLVSVSFSLRTLRWFTCAVAIVLTVVVTRFGAAHPEYRSANLVDSFLSGGDQVTIAMLHLFWRAKVPVPGVASRWIIAVALLLGYRQLEKVALSRQAPELDLSAIGRGRPVGCGYDLGDGRLSRRHGGRPTPAERQAALAAELRFRLPAMEIRSPSILPGGARTNALASIAESSGVSGAGMVSAVLRFAGLVWPQPRLLRVRSWVEPARDNRITVLLEDVKTGLPIATKTVADKGFKVTASMVAGYIARGIFAMDRTVPEWCYGVADGRDLGAMQLVRLKRYYAACPGQVRSARKEQIHILRSETGTVRTAGIVRYELAQLLALDDQHLESFRLHAMNRELHPRFYRGRYRLALSLEMIANPWHHFPSGAETRRKLAETLEIIYRYEHQDAKSAPAENAKNRPLGDAKNTLQEDAKKLRDDKGLDQNPCLQVPSRLSLKLLEIAAKELRELRAQLSLAYVMRDALLRRAERAVWLPHCNRQHRRSFQDGVYAAELLVAIRRGLNKAAETNPSWLKHARLCWHLRKAVRIARRVAGVSPFIYPALADPRGKWWVPEASKPWRDRLLRARRHWPLRRRSRPSWQAAYNTACLYAALADAAGRGSAPGNILRELERLVIVSLRRVMDDPTSELERAWDWFNGDPDFGVMRENQEKFKAFRVFLGDLLLQEYPTSMFGKCDASHRNSAEDLAAAVRDSTGMDLPIYSPVPCSRENGAAPKSGHGAAVGRRGSPPGRPG